MLSDLWLSSIFVGSILVLLIAAIGLLIGRLTGWYAILRWLLRIASLGVVLVGGVVAFSATTPLEPLIVLGWPQPFLFEMPLVIDRFAGVFILLIGLSSLLLPEQTHDRERARIAILTVIAVGFAVSTNILGQLMTLPIIAVLHYLPYRAHLNSRAGRTVVWLRVVTWILVAVASFVLSGGALFSDFQVIAAVGRGLPDLTVMLAAAAASLAFLLIAGVVATPRLFFGAREVHLVSSQLIVVAVGLAGGLRLSLFIANDLHWLVTLLWILVGGGLGVWSLAKLRGEKKRASADLVAALAVSSLFIWFGLALAAGEVTAWGLLNGALFAGLLGSILAVVGSLHFAAQQAVVEQATEGIVSGLARVAPWFSLSGLIGAVSLSLGLGLTGYSIFSFGFYALVDFWAGGGASEIGFLAVTAVGFVTLLVVLGGLTWEVIKNFSQIFLGPTSEQAQKIGDPSSKAAWPVYLSAAVLLIISVFLPVIAWRLGASGLVEGTGTALASFVSLSGGYSLTTAWLIAFVALVVLSYLKQKMVVVGVGTEPGPHKEPILEEDRLLTWILNQEKRICTRLTTGARRLVASNQERFKEFGGRVGPRVMRVRSHRYLEPFLLVVGTIIIVVLVV